MSSATFESRATELVELLRRGIAGALEIGLRPRNLFNKPWLALAQTEGTIVEALDTRTWRSTRI